jgi:transposase
MRVPVVIPTLEKIYGTDILSHFNANFKDLDIQEAYNKVLLDAQSKTIAIKFSSAALYAPLKELGFSFKRRPKNRQADPNRLPALPKPQGSGKRGKVPFILNKLKSHFENEEQLKIYLQSLSHLTLEEAINAINVTTNEDFQKSHVYSFFNRYEVSFKKLKNRKSKQITGQVEMTDDSQSSSTPHSPASIAKIQYKCACGHEKATKHNQLLFPLGLKGMKCICGKWGSFVATVISPEGTRHFAVIETQGIGNVKILGEEEVDENLNPIHQEEQIA